MPTNQTERNFPPTISVIFMGCENSQNSVPDCSSSAKVLILMAGMMNIKSQGESTKKLCKVALPISKILKLFSKKNRNNAEIMLNAAMISHALQFPKKFQSSFLNIAIINGLWSLSVLGFYVFIDFVRLRLSKPLILIL